MKKWLQQAAVLAVMCLGLTCCRAASVGELRVVAADGERYLYLKDLAALYGCSAALPDKRIVLQNKWQRLTLAMDGREAAFSGIGVWLNAPTKRVNGRWAVAEVDVRKVIDPLFRPSAYLGARTYRTVVLDPGHGGNDRGARGRRGVEEKRAVLDIAKRVRLHLVNEGFKVFLTRDGDRFIELEERTKLAAARGADIFVSIHLNAAPSFRPKGIETFVLTPAGYASTAASSSSRRGLGALAPNRFDHSNTLLGYYIQRGVVERTGSEDRGLRRARFLVLKTAPCPAALVECGFLSNPYEEELLLSSDYRERIAQGIARGILDYANAIKRAQPAPKK